MNEQEKRQYLSSLQTRARERGIPVLLRESSDFLEKLVLENKPKRILEVGTAVGFSSSLMLLAAGDSAEIVTIEIDEDSYLAAKKTYADLDFTERVTLYLGDACEIVPNMSGRFDFVFLDGPKSHYADFYPFIKRMLVSGGILVADNVLFRETVLGGEKALHSIRTIVTNMRKFLSVVEKDADFSSHIYDIGDGLLVAKKEN